MEHTGIVALSHDPGEFVEDLQRGSSGKLRRCFDADGPEIGGNAFADVRKIFEALNRRRW